MIVRSAQPIATANKPATDRRAIFVSLENEAGEINLLIPQQTERFGQLRCIYIDTSAQDSNGDGCTIATDLGQNITALAGTQGYYPVFLPFVSVIKVSSNEAVNLLLLDFDMAPATWATVANSEVVPDPLHVIIDNQPIGTNATVQNWLTNYPVSQNSSWIVSQGGNWAVNAMQSGAWSVSIANFPVTQAVSISNLPIGVTQSGAWSVNANITNASLPVTQSGTWNVGITGTATVTWSTAKPVSISNFPATQAVSGTVAVNNFPSVYNNDAISAAIAQSQFTANGTKTVINSARTFLNNVVVSGINLTNTSNGTLVFNDGSGNFVFTCSIPVLSNFTGEIIAFTNIALPLIQGGNSGSLVLSSCTITGGLLAVYLGSK